MKTGTRSHFKFFPKNITDEGRFRFADIDGKDINAGLPEIGI